ncbi:hypothetical protein DAPPUDRAFT_236017 [Daphnia pulex]|uniref:Uncharacterized protein n=1 Tax=Daphnia pulex TaxID=6669 RepID=E9FZP7_DAPPU|nr:hypothetical protein DAPPUDRAFT_236017 [Daphnia pulex]|eukprot:EFX87093.1 hypothetical protein DAPPUDRAFT_236017 [Daphnia pulex]
MNRRVVWPRRQDPDLIPPKVESGRCDIIQDAVVMEFKDQQSMPWNQVPTTSSSSPSPIMCLHIVVTKQCVM